MRSIRSCHISITSRFWEVPNRLPYIVKPLWPKWAKSSYHDRQKLSNPASEPETGLFFATKYGILEAVLPINGKRAAPHRVLRREQLLWPSDTKKGGLRLMVTYTDLIQLGILIVGIISLFIQASNKKK